MESELKWKREREGKEKESQQYFHSNFTNDEKNQSAVKSILY